MNTQNASWNLNIQFMLAILIVFKKKTEFGVYSGLCIFYTEKWLTHLDPPRLIIHASLLPKGDFLPVPEIGYCKGLGGYLG